MNLKDALKRIYLESKLDYELTTPFLLHSKLLDYCNKEYDEINECKRFIASNKKVNYFDTLINNTSKYAVEDLRSKYFLVKDILKEDEYYHFILLVFEVLKVEKKKKYKEEIFIPNKIKRVKLNGNYINKINIYHDEKVNVFIFDEENYLLLNQTKMKVNNNDLFIDIDNKYSKPKSLCLSLGLPFIDEINIESNNSLLYLDEGLEVNKVKCSIKNGKITLGRITSDDNEIYLNSLKVPFINIEGENLDIVSNISMCKSLNIKSKQGNINFLSRLTNNIDLNIKLIEGNIDCSLDNIKAFNVKVHNIDGNYNYPALRSVGFNIEGNISVEKGSINFK